jgi:hypothetical protein
VYDFRLSSMSKEVIVSIFYIILSACIIYPPVEFVSAGFTIPCVFSRVLGSEDEDFVSYHIKRVIVTLGVYSVLPLGYIIALFASEYFQDVSTKKQSQKINCDRIILG